MKFIFALLLVSSLVALASSETILEVIAQEPIFSQVNESLEGKPVASLLNETTATLTFFAPVNQQTPLDLTETELVYHVLNGTAVNVSELKEGTLLTSACSLDSLKGAYQHIKVTVDNTSQVIFLNNVELNVTALTASNGVIHSVSAPIAFPKDLHTLVGSVSSLSTLATLLGKAGITLNDSVEAVTAFAPADSAFQALPSLITTYLASPAGLADLQEVLKLHVATNVYYSAGLQNGEVLETLSNENLTVSIAGSSVSVNGATVIAADELASNGVAHVIDKVIVPTAFKFNLRKALEGLGLTDFVKALSSFNLTQYLDNSTPYTIFAPTNAALAGKTATAGLLQYHIVGQYLTTLPEGLVQSQLALPSGNQAYQQLVVSKNGAKTFVNGVEVPAAQSLAGVGAIYVIDAVLTPPSNTIVETAKNGGFTKLVEAIANAGVASVLSDTTVFAPVDSAFAGPIAEYLLLNTTQSNADLVTVLQLHVAAGKNYYYAGGEPALPDTVVTLNPDNNITVTKTNGTVYLNGKATVVNANVLASNGVVHAIDNVLIPEDFKVTTDKVVQGYKATDFLSLLAKANLTNYLTGEEAFTIFAFTDTAYDSAPQELIDDPSKWPRVLQTHLYNGTIASLEAGQNYTMLSGEILEVVNPTTLQIRGSEDAGKPGVVGGPVATSNGVVYVINGILSIKSEPKDDGLSDTAIGFIVIGCIVGVLLIIGAAGGGYWYYRRRAGYEQIGDNAF